MSEPTLLQMQGLLHLQLCVPGEWTDEQVVDFAEQEQPCGSSGGWSVNLGAKRVPCADGGGMIHVIVSA